MVQSHEFVTQFHNVQGNTISERKEAFSRLLKRKNLFSNDQDLSSALKDIQPKTYLESLFYVDTLIYFKRTAELLEVFKQGNEVHISKIIKQYWFIKEVFENTTAEQFVNEFLPCTSFITRMKVLKKLALNLDEEQMDEVFDFVEKRYGLHIAVKFLQYCSSKKVIATLSNNEIILRPVQVKAILEKDLLTFKYYLQYYKDSMRSSYSNSLVIKYLGMKYPEELLKLRKEGKISSVRVGRRISKKLIDIAENDIIRNVSYYADFVNKSVIVRKLQGSFKSVYSNVFPKEISELRYYSGLSKELLRYYPKKHQWNLFSETFFQVLQKDVLDNLEALDSELIMLCPEKQIIQKWAEIKYMAKNEYRILKYAEPTKALALLQEKINVTSSLYDRLGFLNLIVDLCVQNEDMDLLEQVLDYFCHRHRNEEAYVTNHFLSHISSYCELQDFTKKHWQYINEQLNILRIKNEFSYPRYSIFLKRYLEFLCKTGESLKDCLVSYINDTITARSPLALCLRNPKVEKELVILMINLIPSETEQGANLFGPKFNINNFCNMLISYVLEFSISYKDYYIDLLNFPILMNYIMPMFNKSELTKSEYDIAKMFLNYNFNILPNIVIEKTKLLDFFANIPAAKISAFIHFITNMVTKKNRSELENDMLHLYFDKIHDVFVCQEIHHWFMENEPQTILPYVDKIVKKDAKLSVKDRKNVSHLKQIKLLSHFNIDAKYIDFYKSIVVNPKHATSECIKLLSILDSTVGFITLIEEVYLPKKNKLNLSHEKMKLIYPLQREIAKTIKNVSEPCKMLPLITKFCVGDYLQSALHSLYSIFYRSFEKELPFYIDILANGAVSVRKHAVFLSCELLNSDFVMNILQTTNDQNISSQKHLFLAMWKYFLKRPTQVLFDTLMSKLLIIDKNDNEILNMLTTVDMPRNFRVAYIEKCWKYFESLKDQINVRDHLNSLLRKIFKYKIISALSNEFCMHIIIEYFSKDVLNLESNHEKFACQVLKYRRAERIENFGIIFDIILTFKNDGKFSNIYIFFNTLYSFAVEGTDEDFVNMCSEHWLKIFSPLERFEEFVLLQLLILKYKSAEPFIINYGKNVITFFEKSIKEYGVYVHKIWLRALEKIFDSLSINKYTFFDNVLQFRSTPPICMLVLESLSSQCPVYAREHVDNIVKIIKEVEDPSVKIYYNLYDLYYGQP